ncbi:uncharacterized protein LOC107009712 isoform X2 [Solanum pennellii]|uniref:Uncharacterized protein LOC107009712 isoform X2 n=1 Tax=Solanum pennellii TaxID=28526 RepID=A0ABM1V3L5_SOLPN|nr:uncharacterized protein LOC107009712 isoform X2 [Solanum pennellii]
MGDCQSLAAFTTSLASPCQSVSFVIQVPPNDPTVRHVYREQNKLADSLAVLAFSSTGSTPTVLTTTFSSPPPSTLVVLCRQVRRRVNTNSVLSAHSSSMYIHGSTSTPSSAPVIQKKIYEESHDVPLLTPETRAVHI